jgi:cyclophilin family peptidyl-prolyl cis-trans isomerase
VRIEKGFAIAAEGAMRSLESVAVEAQGLELKQVKGAVSIVRVEGKESQLRISLKRQAALDGKHVVFGKVREGMDVLADVEAEGEKDAGEQRPALFLGRRRVGLAVGRQVEGAVVEPAVGPAGVGLAQPGRARREAHQISAQ